MTLNHNTFPRSGRIRRKADFNRIFREGRRQADTYFTCWLVQHNDEESRLGMAVSRKTGNAVTRNRIKRYLREYFRTHRCSFRVPADVVVVARPGVAALDYVQCAASMDRLLRRGGVLDG